jgi:hypothetical protein
MTSHELPKADSECKQTKHNFSDTFWPKPRLRTLLEPETDGSCPEIHGGKISSGVSGYRLEFTLLPRFRVCGWVIRTSRGELWVCNECLGGYRGGSGFISAWESYLNNNYIFSFVNCLYTIRRSSTPIFISAQRTT